MKTELCFSRATHLRFKSAAAVYFVQRRLSTQKFFVSLSASMIEDLSRYHHPVSKLFARSRNSSDWDRYRLSEEQLEFFRENGYLKGVRVLSDEQVEALRTELEQLMDPAHASRHLFHEYHSNESTDPNRVVFHALGAWRVLPGFHDLLWNPAFLVPEAHGTVQ